MLGSVRVNIHSISIGLVFLCIIRNYLIIPIAVWGAILSIVGTHFYHLPAGVTNGEWSALAIEQGYGHASIDELVLKSDHVVRVKIIDKRFQIFNIGRPGYARPYLYSVYSLKVLQVYKGDLEQYDIIEISQRKMRNFPASQQENDLVQLDVRQNIRNIRIPLATGDDLILFLNFVEQFRSSTGYVILSDMENMWLFNRIQGVYYYTAMCEMSMCEDWTFQPVNARNNLLFTTEDLNQIIERYAR